MCTVRDPRFLLIIIERFCVVRYSKFAKFFSLVQFCSNILIAKKPTEFSCN